MLARLIRECIDLFFPRYCLLCQRVLVENESDVCLHCWHTLPATNYHIEADNPVAQRLYGMVPVQHAMALYKFTKTGLVRRLLHQLKYRDKPQLGFTVGHWYGQALYKEGYKNTFDLIVPVPLHASRQRIRGYNQSALFAQGLSRGLLVPWDELVLQRTCFTASQTKKERLARWQNTQDAFQVGKDQVVTAKHVLLVDDLITTGATIVACAKVLLQENCSAVSVATIASADLG